MKVMKNRMMIVMLAIDSVKLLTIFNISIIEFGGPIRFLNTKSNRNYRN